MIETTQEAIATAGTPVAPAPPSEPQALAPDERDFLQVSAMRGLFEIGRLMQESLENVPEANRGSFTKALQLTTEVIGTLDTAIREGRGLPPRPPVAGGVPKSDNDPMEARITALETDMRDVRDRLVRVEVKFDTLDKKVDLLPSKDFVVSEVSKSANKIIIWVVVAVGAAQLIPSLVLPLLKHFGI